MDIVFLEMDSIALHCFWIVLIDSVFQSSRFEGDHWSTCYKEFLLDYSTWFE